MPKLTRSSKSQSTSRRRTRSQDVSRRTLRSHNEKPEPTSGRKRKKQEITEKQAPEKKSKKKKKMLCSECKKEFSYESAYKSHLREKKCLGGKKSKMEKVEIKRPRGRPPKVKSSKVDSLHEENRSVSSSPSIQDDGPVRCSVCRNTYRSQNALENHIDNCVAYVSTSEESDEVEELDEIESDDIDDPKRRPEYEEDVVISDDEEIEEDEDVETENVPKTLRNSSGIIEENENGARTSSPSTSTSGDITATTTDEETSCRSGNSGEESRSTEVASNIVDSSSVNHNTNDIKSVKLLENVPENIDVAQKQKEHPNKDTVSPKSEGLGSRIAEAVLLNVLNAPTDDDINLKRENYLMTPSVSAPILPDPSISTSTATTTATYSSIPNTPPTVPSSLKSPFSISSLGLDQDNSNKSITNPSSSALVASVERFFCMPSSTNSDPATNKLHFRDVPAISESISKIAPSISTVEQSAPPLLSQSEVPQHFIVDAKPNTGIIPQPVFVPMTSELSSSKFLIKPQVSPGRSVHSIPVQHGQPSYQGPHSPGGMKYYQPFGGQQSLPPVINGYHTAANPMMNHVPTSSSCETITFQDTNGQIVRIPMPVVPSLSPSSTVYNTPNLSWQTSQQQQLLHLQQHQHYIQHPMHHHQQAQQHLLSQQHFQQQIHPLGLHVQSHHQHLHRLVGPPSISPQGGYAQNQYIPQNYHVHNHGSPWMSGTSAPITHSLSSAPVSNPNFAQMSHRQDSLVVLQRGNILQQSALSMQPMPPTADPLASLLASQRQDYRQHVPSQQPSGYIKQNLPEKQHGRGPNSPNGGSHPCPCDVCLRKGSKITSALNGSSFTQSATGLQPIQSLPLKRKSEESKGVETPRKLKKILPAPSGSSPAKNSSLALSDPRTSGESVVHKDQQNFPPTPGNIAVVRPLENPLQKLSDQISQLGMTLDHTVRKPVAVESVKLDIPEKPEKVKENVCKNDNTALRSPALKEPVKKKQPRKKAAKTVPISGEKNKAKSIKVTLKRKEGGDSYAIKNVCETGKDGGGTMRSLKIKAKITTGDQAGTATEVVVVPIVHAVPIPYGEDGNRTIAEDDNVPEEVVAPVLQATSMADLTVDKSTGEPKAMTHRTAVVYEVKCNDKVLYRSSDVRTVWGHVFELVQGTRMNTNLPPLAYPSTDIALPSNKPTQKDLGFNTLGLVHRAVQFLLQQLPEPQREEKPKTKARSKKVNNYIEDSRPESPGAECITGCARTEGYKSRKPFDMFGWLASKHRSLPAFERKGNDIRKPELPISLAHMRYKTLREKSPRSLGVFYSTIHGRGLFTRRDISEGEIVIEYAGEVIRSVLEDYREKLYESKGYGCYMFRIDEYEVVDATMRGNAARFINHSCEPNCKSKVVEIQGKNRILIYALRKILGGEELTYDYHFRKERRDKKIPCTCGSQRCRKFLN